MRSCPACSSSVPEEASSCPACGQPLAPDATVLSSNPSLTRNPDSGFEAGALVKARYRIVSQLGRGGMGEVYRADDLKLGQSVALKFLSPGLEREPERLRRLLEEVRTARQVTHPNVCRVHDVDEFEGRHFLSMEYVDGEDLASLLRRIGRLPEERAVEVARQICAGLHAAHEAGVLHRDLKPANVMLDGRGRVRLTDFGLASLTEDAGRDVRSGTPAYMAPEQLAGGRVSVASDVYALGLTLYELFTGRPVFEARSVAEISSMHASQVPSRPSTHVDTLDPAVEAAVLRCLEKEPAARPASALAVAAALPGGDPLAAALAAGETPSPELVADTGTQQALSSLVAVGLAALALGLTLLGSWWAAGQSWIAFMPFDKRPEVLEDRARDLLGELGYTEDIYADPVDHAWGWLLWQDVIRDVAARDSSATRWESIRARPDVAGYWYRSSPRLIVPSASGEAALTRGAVGLTDPPPLNAGEAMVLFDLDGRLRRVEVMPRRFASEPSSEPDWTDLFEAAALDTSRFREVRPRYQRFSAPDVRRAWVGTLPERPEVEYRVEAGASEGRVVLFNFADAATLEGLAQAPSRPDVSFAQRLMRQLPGVVILVVILLLARLAYHNVHLKRADTRGALRFALLMFTLFAVTKALRSHALTSADGWLAEVWTIISAGTFFGAVVAVLHVAVEPVGRQVWPTMFVSSSRLLSRDRPVLRDPLLGRSVLAGMIAGGIYFLVAYPLVRWLQGLDGGAAPWPFGIYLDLLTDRSQALAIVLDVTMEIGAAFLQIAVLVLLQRWVKRRWLAVVVALFVWSAMAGFGDLEQFLRVLAASSVAMVVLLRWGAVALVVTKITIDQCWLARAVDYGAWTAGGAVYAVVFLAVIALYGAWASTGRSIRAA